jgi:hypothetical protein
MRLLGSGTTRRRRRSTPLAHDLALTRHMRVRAVRCHPNVSYSVIPCDERLSSIPHQKARSVHRSICEAPERVSFVRQEVGRDEGIFLRSNDLAAERAVGATSFDPFHARNMNPRASRCLTQLHARVRPQRLAHSAILPGSRVAATPATPRSALWPSVAPGCRRREEPPRPRVGHAK